MNKAEQNNKAQPYLNGACCRADGTFLCLDESTEEEEDTE